MYQSPFWDSINVVPLLLKTFTTFYETCWFSSVFIRAHQLFPSSSTLILSLSSHPIYLKLILELSCHLHLGLQNGLLPSGFPINTLYAFLFFAICTVPHSPSSPSQNVCTWDKTFLWMNFIIFALNAFWFHECLYKIIY